MILSWEHEMDPASERHEIVERLRRDIARRFPGVVRAAAPAAPGLAPYPTGHPALDALLPGGGFPAGRVVAIAGPASSGKLSVALAAVARATAGGSCCAFIDTGGEFFPPSAAACGIDLERLLVVRAPPPAVPRATCVTLQSRAFALVVLDLSRRAAPCLTAAQVMRLGALCREADVTLLALGAPAALCSFTPAAALRLGATRSLAGTRVALEGCASTPPATIELHLVRHASYCLRTTPRLRLAGSPARRRR